MTLSWREDRDAHGNRQVELENGQLRLTFLPELGGRLWSIIDLARGEDILWHHPTLAPQSVVPGAGYDDAFAGGWDELFPSDRAVEIDGTVYPDHGEWWSQSWDWHVAEAPEALSLTLTGRGFSTHHAATRKITLPLNASNFSWQTRITNTGTVAIPYIWRHHPALPIRAGSRLELPAANVVAIAEDPGAISADAFAWPLAIMNDGVSRDLSTLPAKNSGEVWMLYATELPEGYVRVTWPGKDDETTHGIAFTFDPACVSAVTTFATFGGWRNLQTILPEPGVGYPADLLGGVNAGTSAVLGVGETVEYEVAISIW